jgi:hypothetical protein
MNIEQLQSEEKQLLAALEENRKKQREIATKMFTDINGIDIGDEVLCGGFNSVITGIALDKGLYVVLTVGYLRSCPCRYFKLSTNVSGQFCKYLVIGC